MFYHLKKHRVRDLKRYAHIEMRVNIYHEYVTQKFELKVPLIQGVPLNN